MKLRRDCMGTVLLQAQNPIIPGPRGRVSWAEVWTTKRSQFGVKWRSFYRLAGIRESECHVAVPEWKLLILTIAAGFWVFRCAGGKRLKGLAEVEEMLTNRWRCRSSFLAFFICHAAAR